MLRPIFSHLTYLDRFNNDGVWTIVGGHHGLSFAKISEKVTDNFLSK